MADVLSGAANEPNSDLLAALRKLSAEDLVGLLKALKAGGSDLQQSNLDNSKNFPVSVVLYEGQEVKPYKLLPNPIHKIRQQFI